MKGGVSEIRVKQIRINQGVGVVSLKFRVSEKMSYEKSTIFFLNMRNPQIIGYWDLSYLKVILLAEFLQQFGRKISFIEIRVSERMS